MADDKKKSPEEVAEEKMNSRIDAAIERALEKAMPMAMIGVANVLKPKEAEKPVVVASKWSATARCSKCGQMLNVCKEEHVLLVVAPANPRRFRRFPGLTINGQTYISPRPGAPIYVPKENDLIRGIQMWEEEEENVREGRQLTHNSGEIGRGANVNSSTPANPMGFRGMNEGRPE